MHFLSLVAVRVSLSAMWQVLEALSRKHSNALRTVWRAHTHTHVIMQRVRQLYSILTKSGISRQTFVKNPNINTHENPSSGSSRYMRTDGRTWKVGVFHNTRTHLKSLTLTRFCLPILYKTNLNLDVKWPIFLSDFNYNWNLSTDFVKVPNIKFQENPPSRSHADTYGQTQHSSGAFRNLCEHA